MDAALFVPYSIGDDGFDMGYKWNAFEWFAMVHSISVNTVITRLEKLKTKSLLESLGDGFSKIGMHDLWREFAKLEAKEGEFEERRWICEWDESNTHDEASLSYGASSVKLRRMFFLERGFAKLEDVNFSCFPNVTVLKLSRNDESPLNLDVGGLQHLKSLELESREVPVIFVWQRKSTTSVGLVGLGSLSKLGFLRWSNIPADSPCIDEIGQLTDLQVLDLYGGCSRLPDVSKLTLLRVACFRENDAAETITGLSSKHSSLRHLDLRKCKELQSCSGVDELIALEELNLSHCWKLKEVPDLQKLKRLRRLNLRGCRLITSLPGLGQLLSLQELILHGCKNLGEFPDMCNLTSLQILDLQGCGLVKSLPGLENLVRLQSLDTWNCKNLASLPNMQKLTNLQTLITSPHDYPLKSCAGLGDLVSLRYLNVGFDEPQDWPDLSKLTKLEKLYIAGCQAQAFSSLANFVLLETLYIQKCEGVRTLPDLQKLTRLKTLGISFSQVGDMSGVSNLASLQELNICDCDKLESIPDLRKLTRLTSMRVHRNARLRDFRGVLELPSLEVLWASDYGWLYENIGPYLDRLKALRVLDVSYGGFLDLDALAACSRLESLKCVGNPIEQLPDLSNFPKIISLTARDCVKLRSISCSGLLNPGFDHLDVQGCTSLRALPSLLNSRVMREIHVANCGGEIPPGFIQSVKERWPNVHLVTELPVEQASAGDESAHPEQSGGVEARDLEALSVSSLLLFSFASLLILCHRCCSSSK